MSKAFVALFLLVAATSLHAAFYPLHAQCELTWWVALQLARIIAMSCHVFLFFS